MRNGPVIACLDLEGVLIPEIWIGMAEKSGVDELRLTTRDVPDYDELMTRRLSILEEHGLGLPDIEDVIATLSPLPGALSFLDWLRERLQVVILSDTFYPFAKPFMRKLGWPTLFCHSLEVEEGGRITAYRLRQPDQKRKAVQAFHGLAFRTIATGDSYNDTSMLGEADAGILFRPPENVIREFPQYPVTTDYDALRSAFERALAELGPA